MKALLLRQIKFTLLITFTVIFAQDFFSSSNAQGFYNTAAFWKGFPASGYITPVKIQTKTSTGSSSTTISITVTATGAGNLLVVGVSNWRSAGNIHVNTITDNATAGTNTYISANALSQDTTGHTTSEIWFAKNSNSGATTVTITLSGAGDSNNAWFAEFSGMDQSSPLDRKAMFNTQPANTLVSSPLVTPSTVPSVVFSISGVANFESGLHTGSPFTSMGILNGDGMAYLITSASGNYGAIWDQGSAGTWNASTVSFKPASGGVFNLVQEDNVSNSSTAVTVPFLGDQIAGDTNIVVVQISSATITVLAQPGGVTDTNGNNYTLAVGPTQGNGLGQYIYYAKNIAAATAGTNSVTVHLSAMAGVNADILEYSGLDKTSPFDLGAGATGLSTSPNSGNITTTNANDLLVGAANLNGSVNGMGAGYNQRIGTIFATYDIIEDKVVSSTGTYNAGGTQGTSAGWVAQVAAFKKVGTPPAITSVQQNSNSMSSSFNTAQFMSAQSAGNMNIAVVCIDSVTVSISSVQDTSGRTYSLADSRAGNGITQGIYYLTNIASAAAKANTVTANFSTGVTNSMLSIFEYTGLSTTTPLDQHTSSTGNSSAPSSGNVTTTSANELIFAAGCHANGNTVTAGSSGYRFIDVTDSGSSFSIFVQDKLVTSTGTYSAGGTLGGAQPWTMGIATFH
jgi:hypothetical protein